MIRYIIDSLNIISGLLIDKRIPVFLRIIIGIYITVILVAILPILLKTILLGGVLILFAAILGIIAGLYLVFPVYCIMTCLVDIFFGRRLRNYKENGLLKYHLPALTYYFSTILLIFWGTHLQKRISLFNYRGNIYLEVYHALILDMGMSLLYVFIFYLGMWRRVGYIDGGRFFIKILGKHRKFLKLSFIPISFLLAVFGFITAFGDINISFIMVLEFIDRTLSSVKQNPVLYGIVLMAIVYVFSIPVQLLALFINELFTYLFEEGIYYRKMIIKILTPIYKVLKFILF